MKLLIYGGCHALIIKRLIDELSPSDRHEIDLLINFQLVASGEPFPFERLRTYDAVVYSPVENKGDYNTTVLDAACRDLGVPNVRFPWLEWHGYAPGADKDSFWGHRGWFFPGLVALGAEFPDFASFARHARAEFPSDDAHRRYGDFTTARLVEQEERVGCEIRVSDFILGGFRDRRMFLIPDHPTLHLYRYVIGELERLLGTRLVASWPRDLPEPQPEERTPIFPRAAALSGLTFSDTSWRSETQPLGDMDLDAFLALHFHLGTSHRQDVPAGEVVVATACRPTWVVAARREPGRRGPVAVPVFTQMLIRREQEGAPLAHFEADIVAALSAGAVTGRDQGRLSGRHLFREGDWLCRS